MMADLPGVTNQAEHTHISTALEVETLDVNLFRSKTLWLPNRSRGVFGGQVISQAIVSATNCVDKAYGLHASILIFRYKLTDQLCFWQSLHVRLSISVRP
jgi:acyl-CoA thioesterase